MAAPQTNKQQQQDVMLGPGGIGSLRTCPITPHTPGNNPAAVAAAAAQLKLPDGGASDPAFVDFVLELMGHLGYGWEACDAAECKLMAVAEQAVTTAAIGAGGIAATPAATATPGAAAVEMAPGATQAAAQRWLHQFNAGLLRRHARLATAVAAGAAGGRAGEAAAGAAVTGVQAWIQSHLLSEQQCL